MSQLSSVPTKVLKSVGAGTAGKPFPVHAQYKQALKAVGGHADPLAEDDEGSDGDSKKPPRKKKPKSDGDGVPWKYQEIRSAFIKSVRAEKNMSFSDATAVWDESDKKRELLGSLSLPELKRRRFVDKSATENPWAK